MRTIKKLCLCAAMIPMIAAADNRSTEMNLGYTAGNMGLNLGMDLPMEIKGAIQFPAEELGRLGKAHIKAIRLAVGNNLTSQNNSIFITDRLDGTPLYTQKVERLEYGWNEINLATPFEIKGEELFVGFSYESSGEVVSLDGEDDNALANWLWVRQEGQISTPSWSHQSGGAHNLVAVIEGDNLPQNDVAVVRHSIHSYACTQSGTPMSLLLRNNGAATLRSIDVAVTVDGTVETRKVECTPTASNGLVSVNIGELTMDSNNIFDVGVEVTAVNGSPDERPADNAVAVANVVSRRDYAPRKVLLEHFSTMKCANCPNTHTLIEDALRYRDDVIHVVYHAGFRTDELTIPAAETYLWLFTDGQNGNYYAPGAALDRVNLSGYGATNGNQSTPGPVFLPRRETMGKLMDRRLSTPALLDMDIDHHYDAATRRLDVTVNAHIPNGSVERLGATDPRLTVMLTEDGIEGTQVGVTVPMTGPYIHDRALRTVLTDVWGDAATFDGADLTAKTYSIVIPAEWNDANMRIVAFIADHNATSTAGCQVFNAEEVQMARNAGSSVISPSEFGLEGLTVTDGKVMLPTGHSGAEVYGITGRLVLSVPAQATAIDLGVLPAGLYLVRVSTPAGSRTFKVTSK